MLFETSQPVLTRRFCSTAALAVLYLALSVSAQSPDPKPPIPTPLELGKTVECETGPTQRQRFEFAVNAGQYAAFRVQTGSVKFSASVIYPDGRTDALLGPPTITKDARLSFVAGPAGKYDVEIYAWQTSPKATYQISLVELRAATEKEKANQESMDMMKTGFNLGREGKAIEARDLFLGAVQLREKVFGPEDMAVAELLKYLSAHYFNSGDYVNAIAVKERELKIKEKILGKNALELAQTNFDLGLLYLQKGDFSSAESCLLRSLDILKASDQAESVLAAYVYAELGEIVLSRNGLHKAADLYGRALTVLEKLFGPEHYHLVHTLLITGNIKLLEGDTATAQSMFTRALAITEKQYGKNDWRDSVPLNDLGSVYCTIGDLGKCEETYKRAFEINETAGSPYGTTDMATLRGLVRAYSAMGRMEKALPFESRVSENEEIFINLNLAGGSEREKLAFLATLAPLISQNVSTHIALAPESSAYCDLAMTTILRRKGRVQDFLAFGNEASLARLTPDERKLIDQFNEVTTKLSSLALRGPETGTAEAYRKKIADLEKSREELETQINDRNIKFFQHAKPVTIDEVRKNIPSDAALIEFAVYQLYDARNDSFGEARYAVYVLRSQGEIAWKDLGSSKEIDSSVNALRLALREPNRTDVVKLARTLDAKIMQPVRSLTSNARHLLISPDGELNLIPFDALVDENGKYLVERFTFTYLSSGRDLLRTRDEKTSAARPVVVANPAFGPRDPAVASARNITKQRSVTTTRALSDTYFAPLTGTAQEARSIGKLFPDAKFLIGGLATETSLKEVTAPRILHIATHGFFLEDLPPDRQYGSRSAKPGLMPGSVENPLLRSGLALAGANRHGGGDDDGLLTALEASGLNLWGTKLLVLSACDTGLGEVRNGEGVYGLRRAFVIAGAESIVMSLWPVSDQVTRELMTNYYKNLRQGLGRGEALRRVQLQMLTRAGRRHPFYWASFIQSGNWTKLDPVEKPK